LLQTRFNEGCGSVSPDGRWIAYESDELGRSEVFVQAFSEVGVVGRKWQVSYQGGFWPKWRRDGKELFYLTADRRVEAVKVKTGATFQEYARESLFPTGILTPDARFEVASDGQRFLIPTHESEATSDPATVVLNWIIGIKP